MRAVRCGDQRAAALAARVGVKVNRATITRAQIERLLRDIQHDGTKTEEWEQLQYAGKIALREQKATTARRRVALTDCADAWNARHGDDP